MLAHPSNLRKIIHKLHYLILFHLKKPYKLVIFTIGLCNIINFKEHIFLASMYFEQQHNFFVEANYGVTFLILLNVCNLLL